MSFWPSRCFSIVCSRIRGASSWHISKLAFMNFRALSQPSVDHLLPYFEGVCEQADGMHSVVILTLLYVALFFENGDQNAVSPGRWYALSGHDSVETFAKCHHSQLSQAFPYLHWYLVAAHSLATLHPSQCSLSISASLTGLVISWLGALSSVSTRGDIQYDCVSIYNTFAPTVLYNYFLLFALTGPH